MKVFVAHVAITVRALLRTPSYWVPLILFPSLLFTFFGVPSSQGDPRIANILIASWSAFAVIGVSFFQFGVSISQARESRWENYARTLPVGGAPRFGAQIACAMLFLTMALVVLWLVGSFATASQLSPFDYAKLYVVLTVGSVPFVLLGAALGYAAPARGAVPIANLIYLPMSYLGGLWLPPDMLPDVVAAISPWMPTRQLGELAWAAVLGQTPPAYAFIGLTAYAIVGLVVSLVLWRRDETLRFA